MRDLSHTAWVNSRKCYTQRELTHASLYSKFKWIASSQASHMGAKVKWITCTTFQCVFKGNKVHRGTTLRTSLWRIIDYNFVFSACIWTENPFFFPGDASTNSSSIGILHSVLWSHVSQKRVCSTESQFVSSVPITPARDPSQMQIGLVGFTLAPMCLAWLLAIHLNLEYKLAWVNSGLKETSKTDYYSAS